MKHGLMAGLLLIAPQLTAQVYLSAGDNRLTLAQILHPHPEGVILTLPDAQGHSLEVAVQKALDQDPALVLQLTTQELDSRQPSGRELAAAGGWALDRPHWALVGPDRRVYAEGTDAPSAALLAEAYAHSPLRTQADLLREFLRLNPDQGVAQAQLILRLRDLAERRTERVLMTQPKTEGAALLREEDDDRIWSGYATHYKRFFAMNLWRDADPGASSPIPIAAQLSVMAEHSPRLKELAARLMPAVEDALRDKPTDSRLWDVWLSLRAAGAKGDAGSVIEGVDPLPGTRQWPPAAAVEAFVEDARQSGDWHAAEAVLQASFDQNEAFLKRLQAAAKEDAAQRGATAADLGAAFGFAQWNGDTASLVEAKLRLGKLEEADRIFQRVFARVPKPAFAQQAAELARTCGAAALSDKWERMGRAGD